LGQFLIEMHWLVRNAEMTNYAPLDERMVNHSVNSALMSLK